MCRTNNDETRSAGIYVPDAALSNLSIADFSVMSVYVVYIFGRWFSRGSFIAELNVMSVYDKFIFAGKAWHSKKRAKMKMRCTPGPPTRPAAKAGKET